MSEISNFLILNGRELTGGANGDFFIPTFPEQTKKLSVGQNNEGVYAVNETSRQSSFTIRVYVGSEGYNRLMELLDTGSVNNTIQHIKIDSNGNSIRRIYSGVAIVGHPALIYNTTGEESNTIVEFAGLAVSYQPG